MHFLLKHFAEATKAFKKKGGGGGGGGEGGGTASHRRLSSFSSMKNIDEHLILCTVNLPSAQKQTNPYSQNMLTMFTVNYTAQLYKLSINQCYYPSRDTRGFKLSK